MALKAYWKFNGNANDYSGNGNNLGGSTYGAGYFNQATNNAYFTKAIPVLTQKTNFTLGVFIKPVTLPVVCISLFIGNGSTGYGFYIGNGAGGSGSKIYILCGGIGYLDFGMTMAVGKWYRVIIQRTATNWYMWVNGNKLTATFTANPTTPTDTTYGAGPNAMYDENFIDDTALSDAWCKNEYARIKGFF